MLVTPHFARTAFKLTTLGMIFFACSGELTSNGGSGGNNSGGTGADGSGADGSGANGSGADGSGANGSGAMEGSGGSEDMGGSPMGGESSGGDGSGGDGSGGDGSGGDGSGGDGSGGDGSGGDGMGGDGMGGAPPMGDPAGEACTLGTNYSLGEMRLLNNQWTSHQTDQCIFINADRSFGWRWDNRSETGGFDPLPTSQADYPNYPGVEFGINPWGRDEHEWEIPSTSTSLLPLQLADLTTANMTVDVTSNSNVASSWTLAFRVWLSVADPTLALTAPTAELLILFGNDAAYWPSSPEPGAGATVGDYTLYVTDDNWGDGHAYRQWRRNGTVGSSASFNGTLNIKALLDQSGFDTNWYVTRFEIGNDVYIGSMGETTINSLSFEVNGQVRSAR